MYPGWERDQQRSRDLEQARRDLAAAGGGGCVLYPLGALALIGLCCASPSLLEGRHLPFSIPHFGLPHFGGEESPPPEPTQVVQRYMAATIEGKAPAAAAVTCADPHLDPVTTWWARIQARPAAQRPDGITFHSTAGMVREDNAFVTTVVTLTVNGANGAPAQRQSRTFLFNVADEQGWKVCAATTS
ncbi:hypothetical protein [Actinoplanes ianthinogenes]|uniref:Uncharacterized protein n=1 Tax=Actinoplanes ianthinogenes TaxID=122358 RepID=A0ABM7LJN1_9ACTN|nr:hypothetical protein [Actinoplanes ianthinogenes]BCJ39464.1 hypothetical protein Aiant_01210 [Actinoplanes ianthinogenes]